MQFSIVNLNLHPHEAIFIHSKIMATTITEPEVFFCNLDLLLDNSGIDAYYILKKKYEDAYLFIQVHVENAFYLSI